MACRLCREAPRVPLAWAGDFAGPSTAGSKAVFSAGGPYPAGPGSGGRSRPSQIVVGPIWLLHDRSTLVQFTDAVQFTVVFENGLKQRWNDVTREGLALLKQQHDEGAIRFLQARGWTFELQMLFSSVLELCDVSGSVTAVQDPAKLLRMIEDRASAHGLLTSDLSDEAATLCLVLGHTNGRSNNMLKNRILPLFNILVLARPKGQVAYERVEVVRAKMKRPWALQGLSWETGWKKREVTIR